MQPSRRSRLTRSFVTAAIAVCAASPRVHSHHSPPGARSALYAATGRQLTHYDLDAEAPALIKKESITLPGDVQYAWPHPSLPYLYAAWANGSRERPNGLSVLAIDQSGSLRLHGEPAALRARAIHLTLDMTGTHVLVAYNMPSGLSVHRILADGRLGGEVSPAATIDGGIYAHQVRVHPSNGTVILVTRGNVAENGKPEDPGALKILSYQDGTLSNRASIAPNGGYGFQPRHLDFHPSAKWIYVSLEPQNTLQVYNITPDGLPGPRPAFERPSEPPQIERRGLYQRSGTVHVHPNGRFVYQADRATDANDSPGTGAWGGGVNAIGVFAIDQTTGEPTLIQNAPTFGIVPRTFSLDPTGRVLVAANQNRVEIKDGANVSIVPTSLTLFRVLVNGKLDLVRKYDVESTGRGNLFWMGIVPLPD